MRNNTAMTGYSVLSMRSLPSPPSLPSLSSFSSVFLFQTQKAKTNGRSLIGDRREDKGGRRKAGWRDRNKMKSNEEDYLGKSSPSLRQEPQERGGGGKADWGVNHRVCTLRLQKVNLEKGECTRQCTRCPLAVSVIAEFAFL